MPAVKPLKSAGLFFWGANICRLEVRADSPPPNFRSCYLFIWKNLKGAKYGTHLAY